MHPDTTVLIAVLSCVFGFLLAVFLFLILRFTLRNRTMEPRSTTPSALQTHSNARDKTQVWRDRWSTKRRGGATAVRGTTDIEVKAQSDYTDDKTAGEFGATVNGDGTRSYLNGWFALDAPPLINASFRSQPSRGVHERVRTKDIITGDEWEIKTDISDDSDPETYRPQYATI